MFFNRKIYNQLKEHAHRKQVSIVTGMRRTGKTTLVRQLLADVLNDNYVYIDLERLDNRYLFQTPNYDSIVLALKQRGLDFSRRCVIALDEAQLVKDLPSVVKYLYDSYDIKFIISGSSSFYLKNSFHESLAGRKKIFEVFPMDFGEYLTFKSVPWHEIDFLGSSFDMNEYNRIKDLYNDYISFGGFPEVVLAESASIKIDLLEDIISSYVNIDVKWLSDFRKAENIRNLMMMLASRIGAKLDIAKLAALTGLSVPTVNNYVELFEQTYLLHRVSVISKNPDREIVKAKKVYFSDTGIAGRLAGLSSGSLFENTVFNQLRQKGKVNYYSLKNGKEIDFIFNGRIAIEAKETATLYDYTQTERLASNLNIKDIYLVSRYPSPSYSEAFWGGMIK